MFNYFSQSVFYFLSASTANNASLWETIVKTNIINFLIAAIALIWVIKKFNLISVLDKRQNSVIKALKESEERRNRAFKDLEEVEKRTSNLAQEVETLLQDAKQTAKIVADGIIGSAEEEASKMIEQAKKRIELEEKFAARELEQRLIQEAIYSARQLLENTLTIEDKQRSIDEFVLALPELSKKES